ncbi:non-ribosomal peptide synthetase [Alteromonas sp. a30]|uniref:non-ribosomal peptide synthetase n=1 Tax=Alteromonas sp. a30 TaxID=2730917 RepID=UPI00227F0854|nr:non-ribosomal peptide synthetase [Alteromonas sp. a30]MCY7297352.1 amino acid adenylation domain-containing protein [Alteromonas sp. a30]
MSLDALLQRCETSGIKFQLDGEKLSVKAPPGSIDAELAAQLKAQKAELLAFFIGNNTQALAAQRHIQAQHETGPVPLSFGQRRLWLMHEMDKHSAQYNMPFVVLLEGELNKAALTQTFADIVERHHVLRSVYREIDAESCQIVVENQEFKVNWQVLELPFLDTQSRDSQPQNSPVNSKQVQQAVSDFISQPFDLTREIMLRVGVIELSAANKTQSEKAPNSAPQYILMAVMHHIASDAWSVNLLLEQFIQGYQYRVQLPLTAAEKAENSANPLGVLPIQYSDYALWQQEFSTSQAMMKQLDYWQQQLHNASVLHGLPTDYPRPAQMRFWGNDYKQRFDAGLTQGLQQLCQRHELTLFMLMQAALTLLIAKYSASTDVVIGTPVSGRHQAQTESLIGFFVNTLALRVDIEDCHTLKEVALKTKKALLAGLENQDAPFDLVVERLAPVRSSRYNPIFQVMLVVQNSPPAEAQTSDLKVSEFPLSSQTSKFDITLTVTETRDDLRLSWEYATDLFDAETIVGFARSYQALLQQMLVNFEQPIDAVCLCSEEEEAALLAMGQGEMLPLCETVCVEDASLVDNNAQPVGILPWFVAAAEAYPSAIAVSDETNEGINTLRYRQVASLSDNLARALQQAGVQRQDKIGVCVTRNRFLPAVLLGIFKAGAAYVPLDPNYPQSRLHYMTQDAALTHVITDENTRDRMEALPVALLDRQALMASSGQHSSPETPLFENTSTVGYPALSDAAYLIYTSGSTGNPKGVVITHKNVAALLRWAQSTFSDSARAKVLASTSLSFDLSVFELFLPLCFGTQIHIVDNLLSLMQSDGAGITLINTVPSAISTLAQAKAIPDSVQMVNVAGEVLTRATVNAIYQQSQTEQVFNLYGPSEDTTYSTWEWVKKDEQNEPCIGRPIANTRAYVLNPEQQLVPVNMPGELYLAGDGVANGYFNKPELTAQSFVPERCLSQRLASENADNGVNATPANMYATGDVVRWNHQGKLVFLGRKDHQVKIRGFRIEIGEIESALLALEGVEKAAVVVAGEQRDHLVACVVLAQKQDLANQACKQNIKRALAEKLPPHMVPASIQLFDALAHTPSGKIDRKAIQLQDLDNSNLEKREVIAPETDTEAHLLALWQSVLKTQAISVTDDFFQIGGHSLHAARILARLRESGVEQASIADSFQYPSIRAFAAMLDARVNQESVAGGKFKQDDLASEKASGWHIAPRPQNVTNAPLSYAQKRLWFIDGLLPVQQKATYNIPLVLRLQSQGENRLNVALLQSALDQIIQRHSALRTAMQVPQGQSWPEQRIHNITGLPLEEFECVLETQQQIKQKINDFVLQPFDLSEPLKIRAGLFHLLKGQNQESVLALSMHHIVSDGLSVKILLQELRECYVFASEHSYVDQGEKMAQRSSLSASLAPLAIEFADYAYWQQQQQESMQASLDYCLTRLQGIPLVHNLPLDYPRGKQVSYRGARVKMALPKALSARLKDYAQFCGVTHFMVLQRLFAVLLSRWSRESDIVMGTVVANRPLASLEPIIGFFVNTVVLRTQVNASDTFQQILQQGKQELSDAFAHSQLPFDLLLDALKLPRNEAIHPVFQILFSMQNHDDLLASGTDNGQDMAGVKVSGWDDAMPFAKFDLSLNVVEAEGEFICDWEYCCDLFHAHHIEAMAQAYTQLLDACLTQPQLPVGEATMLSEGHVARLLELASGQAIPANHSFEPLPNQFKALCQQKGDASAVCYLPDQRLSFANLYQGASLVAAQLQEKGIGKGDIVGICLPRSTDLILAIVAVHLAGAAYLPLDPSYPPARLQSMLEDAEPRAVLSYHHIQRDLALEKTSAREWFFVEQIALNPLAQRQILGSAEFKQFHQSVTLYPDDAAYVIYTSGSTGKPKGVVVNHGSLRNLIDNLQREVLLPVQRALEPKKTPVRWALNASVSFDASLQGIGMMYLGVELHVLSSSLRQDTEQLIAYFAQQQISLYDCTPSQLRVLLKTADVLQQEHKALKQENEIHLPSVLVGGEKLKEDLWHHIAVRFTAPQRYCWNVYGPTESTVDATIALVTLPLASTDAPQLALSHIGRPLTGVDCLIVDEHLNPVPAGVYGELLLGGSGLAQGYLNRAELTAERFIALPSSVHIPNSTQQLALEKQRFYRTGDLVRWRVDGNLAYLSRMDNQVKLRGYRIELGEIEALLKQSDGVADAVVITDAQQSLLFAYVVPEGGLAEDEPAQHAWCQQLKQMLSQQLPEFMLPHAIMALAALPLSPSGKVDTKALPTGLPQMDIDPKNGAFQAHESASTLTDTEHALAEIWSDLLGLPHVDPNASFYTLGGYSLLLVELATCIRGRFGCQLSLEVLMRHATLRQMAHLIDNQCAALPKEGENNESAAANSYQILRQGNHDKSPLFLLPALDGFGTAYLSLAAQLSGDYPIYAMQYRGFEQVNSVQELAAAYLHNIRKIQPHGPYYLAGWSFGGSLAHEVACGLLAEQEQIALLVKLDSGWPALGEFNLTPEAIVEELAQEYGAFDMAGIRAASGVKAKLQKMLSQGQSSAVLPRSMTLAHLEQRFAIIQHHYRLLSDYQPSFYPDTSHFISAHSSVVNAEHIAFWKVSAQQQSLLRVAGNHHSMLAQPNVQETAMHLDTLIKNTTYTQENAS